MSETVTPERLSLVIRTALFGLLLLAPLPFGGVQPGAVLLIECWAAGLGFLSITLLWKQAEMFPRQGRWLLAGAGVVIAIGLLQLVPLPPGWTGLLVPPTADARDAVAGVLPATASGWRPLTIETPSTVDALLRFVAYVLVAVATVVSIRSVAAVRRLAAVIALSGAFQGLYGAGEYLSGHQHILGYAKVYMLDSATGTFVNRNHYATYLAMTIPFALALMVNGQKLLSTEISWRRRIVGLFGARGLVLFLGMLSGAFAWIGVLLSYSRAGMGAAILAVGLGLLMMARGRHSRALILIGILLATVFTFWQDIVVPGYRFVTESGQLVQVGGRWPVWRQSIDMIRDYSFIGSGLGTFQLVFPLYRPPEITKYWDHAHNDWLEGVIEMGVPALALIAIPSLIILVRRVQQGRDASAGSVFVAASTVAVVVAGSTALIDFTLRIPGAALLAVVAVAVAVCPPSVASKDDPSQRRSRSEPKNLVPA